MNEGKEVKKSNEFPSTQESTKTNYSGQRKRKNWLFVASICAAILAVGCFAMHALFGQFGLFQLFESDVFLKFANLFAWTALLLFVITGVIIAIWRKELKSRGYIITAILLVSAWISFAVLGYFHKIMHNYAERAHATYNLRLLSKAINSYARDHNGCLPVASQWCDLLIKNDPTLSKYNFKHPRAPVGAGECNIAYNANLGGLRLNEIPEDIVLLFEANGSWNLAGGLELLDKTNFDRHYVEVLLVNGEIKEYWIKYQGVASFDPNMEVRIFKPLHWSP